MREFFYLQKSDRKVILALLTVICDCDSIRNNLIHW